LRRFLADEPILARPPSALDRLRKFARRHTGLGGGGIAPGLALIPGVVGTTPLALGEGPQRRPAAPHAPPAPPPAGRAPQAVAGLSAHDVADARRQLDEAPVELRDWEWRHLHSRLDDSSAVISLPDRSLAFLIGASDGLRVGAFTPAGLRVMDLVGGEDETLP